MHPITILQVLWIFASLWFELGVFVSSSFACKWPSVSNVNIPQSTAKVLVVADPQILDEHSYPGRPHSLVVLSQYIVDLFLRKSWRVIQRLQPELIIFLGDMMDNGRIESGPRYEEYFSRFKRIFRSNPLTPVYYVPGNHDTGLGSMQVAHNAKQQYITHFGPLNQAISIVNHTLVLIDAPGLVDEDYQRAANGVDYQNWVAINGGTVEYVSHLPEHGRTILFSHIPLSRQDNSPCGPHRERGTIHRGVGIGYQNTLGTSASNLLLEKLRPFIVFSGDDHDMCEYMHTYTTSEGNTLRIPEVTIKSFSMAMGIRRPGFQLLALASPHAVPAGSSTFAEAMCLLPDQLSIYLQGYLPFLGFSLIVLAIFNWFRVRRRSGSRTFSHLESQPSDDEVVRKSDMTRRKGRLHTHSICRFIPKNLLGGSFRRGNTSFWMGFFLDMRDVAIYPLSVFLCTTLWAFLT